MTTYTSGCYKVIVKLPCGGLRSGYVTNGFDFVWLGEGSPGGSDITEIANVVQAAYTSSIASHQGWYYYLSNALDRTTDVSETAVYTVDPIGTDPEELGPPIHTQMFTLGNASGEGGAVDLPNAVAACISFRSDYGTDEEYGTHTRPRADDRGRIYLGPLNGALLALTGVDLQYACISTAAVADLGLNFNAMQVSAASDSWLGCVWSRKEKVFKGLTDYSVNNHFDSQRRRGSEVPSLAWTSIG